MWDLADEAKRLGIADLFDARARPDPRRTVRGRRQRLDLADQVRRLPEGLRLAHRGHRRHQHPVVDRGPVVAARPARATSCRWSERHDFDSSLADSHRERDEAIDAGPLAAQRRRRWPRSTSCSASAPVANFAWWNEDHNYYIDLRVVDPDAPRRAGARPRPSAPTRTTTPRSCSSPSCRTSAAATSTWKDKQSIATARHEYYDHYQDLAADDPEGRRHAARQGRGPGADRDLRHAQPLLRGPQGRRRTPPSSTASRRRPASTPAGRG